MTNHGAYIASPFLHSNALLYQISIIISIYSASLSVLTAIYNISTLKRLSDKFPKPWSSAASQYLLTQSTDLDLPRHNYCLHEDIFCFHLGTGDAFQSTGLGAEVRFKLERNTLQMYNKHCWKLSTVDLKTDACLQIPSL